MRKRVMVLFVVLCVMSTAKSQEINLHDSAISYYKKGELKRAIYFQEMLVKSNELNPKANDSALAISWNDLALMYTFASRYSLAEQLFFKALDKAKAYYSDKHQQYAAITENLARVYKETGRYQEAELSYKRAIKIYQETVGEDNNFGANAYNNLATLYILLEDYKQAEINQQKSLEIRKEVSGKNSSGYGVALNNLALIYRELGSFEKAENLYRESLATLGEAGAVDSLKYANIANNLADLYYKMNKLAAADSLEKIALRIMRKNLETQNGDYANLLHNIASLYRGLKRFKESEELFLESLSIREKVFGKNHQQYALGLRGLAGLYFKTGDFNKAYDLFKQAMMIYQKTTGNSNVVHADDLFNIASLCRLMNREQESDKYYFEALELERQLILTRADFLTQSEFVNYLEKRKIPISDHFNLLTLQKQTSLLRSSYNTVLLSKGVALLNTSSLSNKLSNVKNSEISITWKDYKSNKTLLAKQLSLPVSKRLFDVDSLTDLLNLQEKKLLYISTEYRNLKKQLSISWKDVQNKLQEKETAIEFVRFNHLTNTNADTAYYAALLIRPQDTVPVFVKLCREEDLQKAMQSFLYKGNFDDQLSLRAGGDIFKTLWKPLETYLQGVKTIYFAPDGLLHQLAFAAIPYPGGQLLIDHYALVQLTSTRQLCLQDSLPFPKSIALFGGVDFNRQKDDTTAKAVPDPYAYAYRQNRSAVVDSFAPLRYSAVEIKTIGKIMEPVSEVRYFESTNATEAAFRSLSDSYPEVIHLATHGFAVPDTGKPKGVDNVFRLSDNPLLRSGLVLAGGNKGWKGRAGADEDDGILTALEISAMSLPKTQLAVLSACRSGLGDLRGSEGVFGLQRAFKLAGVRYIMASLWPVNDEQTALFMKTFYTQWKATKNIRIAFVQTQKMMRKKKVLTADWAAFTLVE